MPCTRIWVFPEFIKQLLQLLEKLRRDFLINRTCFTASLENSISYIAFTLYTVKKIIQRLILGHSEGISVPDIFNTSLDGRKFFL